MTNSSEQNQTLTWRDGIIPVSTRFDDPYFSLENGLAETRHVFLAGNNLPARFAKGFRIAELGFGTGLNMFTALHEWRACGMTTPLHYSSFEAYPLHVDEMVKALAAFPEVRAIASPFLEEWAKGARIIATGDLTAHIHIGDARETLPQWQGTADAWFLDGFSPAKNPELWGDDLLHQVARHTAPNGTIATYTAAGHVRRALTAAGFSVSRIQGFGRKRHMTTACLP